MRVATYLIFTGLLVGTAQAQVSEAESGEDSSLTTLLWRYGGCVVTSQPDRTKAYLLADIDQRARAPSDRSCEKIFLKKSVQVTFRTDSYRSALANALVKREFAQKGATRIIQAPPLRWPSGAGFAEKWDADRARLGECLVRANPEGARLWILTPPGSTQDFSQSKSLAAAFEQCVQKATIVHYFDRETMRGPVALSYLRLAYSVSQPGSGTER